MIYANRFPSKVLFAFSNNRGNFSQSFVGVTEIIAKSRCEISKYRNGCVESSVFKHCDRQKINIFLNNSIETLNVLYEYGEKHA